MYVQPIMKMKAIILGASGLIGSNLLGLLLADEHYKEVLAVVRHKLNLEHPKLTQLEVDFDHLYDYVRVFSGDVVFCCLGTTKNKTPDQAEYRKIDYQYPIDAGWIAFTNGAKQYHLISALGADPNSSIFYSKLKGEVERDLQAIPFKSIYIYQPSLLVGDRQERRASEKIMAKVMQFLNPLMVGGLKKYRSIHAATVARAMLQQSLNSERGRFILPSDEIQQIGG